MLGAPKNKAVDEVAANMTNGQLNNVLQNSGYTNEQLSNLDNTEKEEAVTTDANYRYSTATTKLLSSATIASEYPSGKST